MRKPLPCGPDTPTLPPLKPLQTSRVAVPRSPEPTARGCLDKRDRRPDQANVMDATRAQALQGRVEDSAFSKKAAASPLDYTRTSTQIFWHAGRRTTTAILVDLVHEARYCDATAGVMRESSARSVRCSTPSRNADLTLNGGGTLIDEDCHSLRDLEYCQTRNRDAPEGALRAHQEPVTSRRGTIRPRPSDGVSHRQRQAGEPTRRRSSGTDSVTAIYDVFMHGSSPRIWRSSRARPRPASIPRILDVLRLRRAPPYARRLLRAGPR